MIIERLLIIIFKKLEHVPVYLRTESVCRTFLKYGRAGSSIPLSRTTEDMCYWMALMSVLHWDDKEEFLTPAIQTESPQADRVMAWYDGAVRARALKNTECFNNLHELYRHSKVYARCMAKAFGAASYENLPEEFKTAKTRRLYLDQIGEMINHLPEMERLKALKEKPQYLIHVSDDHFKSCYPVALDADIRAIHCIRQHQLTRAVLSYCVSKIIDRPVTGLYEEAMIDHLIKNGTMLSSYPFAIEQHVSLYIYKNSNETSVKRYGQALKIEHESYSVLETALSKLEPSDLEITNRPMQNVEMLFKQPKLRIIRARAIAKFNDPADLANLCKTNDQWLAFQEIHGSTLALKHHPEGALLFLMNDLDI